MLSPSVEIKNGLLQVVYQKQTSLLSPCNNDDMMISSTGMRGMRSDHII